MRRQRFIYTLPSQDDSSVVFDSDSTSIISSQLSYPQTAWSHIISPEPESLIPYCMYPYPCFPISTEELSNIPGFYNEPLTPCSLTSFDAVTHYNDELTGINLTESLLLNSTASVSCNTPYGDMFMPEDYAPYEDSFSHKTIESIPQAVPSAYPMVANYGAVTILLRHLIRIDISPNKAVYVTNPPASCVAAINSMGNKSCVFHPNGRVLCNANEIHMVTLNKKAKVNRRGIVFTSTDHCLSYIVDASGTKTTAEKFQDLDKDFSMEIFYADMVACNYNIEECYNMINASAYKSYWNGDEVWLLGGFRIKQNEKGDVKVSRNGSKHVIRCSPTTGQISVKNFMTEISIGRYPNNYFLVKKGDKRITASVKGFNVQCGTQKAGFNSFGRVVLF